MAAITTFFFAFNFKAVATQFGMDEMRNLYSYWVPSLGEVFWANFIFWSKFIRPLGAAYYLPLYHWFGLNPVPFNVVRIAALLVNTMLFFKLSIYLTRSWWIATLASFPIAYHANVGILAYDGAFIYDVLCGGFFFGALLYYLHCRRNGRRLGLVQMCIFLALYIAALDAKEMAVSLPIIVLAYESLFKKRQASLFPGVIAAALTLLFVIGKTRGSGALTELDAYRPVITWARFTASNARFLNEIFYTNAFTAGRVLALWTLLLLISLRNCRGRIWDARWLFLWVWVVVTPLPIAFLPDRGTGTLYIVAAGWAMLAAVAARVLLHDFARKPFAGFSRAAIMATGLVACVAGYWHETARAERRVSTWHGTMGADTKEVVEEFEALRVRPAPRSRVVFLNYPFPDRYYTLFIAALFWKDRTIEINLQRHDPLPVAELAKMDYVLDHTNNRFIVLRAPR